MARGPASLVGGLLVATLSGCNSSPDPEAAIRFDYVRRVALAEDAGHVFHLTSTGDVFFDDGWYPMETEPPLNFRADAWRWMGLSGIVRLRAHTTPMKVSITGWVPFNIVGNSPAMSLRWNGARLETWNPPPGRFTREVIITPEMQRGAAWGELVVETSSAGYTGNDPRLLGFALSELRWEPAQP